MKRMMKLGGLLLLVGVVLLVMKGMSAEYVDAEGILHEQFYLIPMGFVCIFGGLLSFIIAGASKVMKGKNKE